MFFLAGSGEGHLCVHDAQKTPLFQAPARKKTWEGLPVEQGVTRLIRAPFRGF